MSYQAEAHEYEENRPRNFVARWRERIMGHEEFDEEEEEDTPAAAPPPSIPRPNGGTAAPMRRGGTTLRMDHARNVHITVRRSVHGFDDARRAADGLKEGQQQIVNLEQTPADMAERIVDFLNGATYALDGCVEKIGEQVYLFTPSTVTIDIEDKPAPGSRTSFLDRA